MMKCFLVSTCYIEDAIEIYKSKYDYIPNFTAFIPFSWPWEQIVNKIVSNNQWYPWELPAKIIMLYQEKDASSEWRRKLVNVYEDYLTCKTAPFAINPGPDYCAIDLTNGLEPKGILFHD